jgi:hypothetical protein
MTEKAVAVVVKNSLPAEIVAIDPALVAQASELSSKAQGLKVIDIPTLEVGNDLYKAIDTLAKAISAQRLDITRPIDALKKAIIAAEESATAPLLDAKKALGEKIVACQRELTRLKEEADRKAREEAEKKAREERDRLEKERQEKIAQQKKEAEEAAALGLDIEDAEPIQEPPPVVVVPVVIPPSMPDVPKAAARVSVRQKLVIFDEALIPVAMAGVILRVPDPKAIEKLLKAGVAVPGARLESVESVGAAGGRK